MHTYEGCDERGRAAHCSLGAGKRFEICIQHMDDSSFTKVSTTFAFHPKIVDNVRGIPLVLGVMGARIYAEEEAEKWRIASKTEGR